MRAGIIMVPALFIYICDRYDVIVFRNIVTADHLFWMYINLFLNIKFNHIKAIQSGTCIKFDVKTVVEESFLQ